MKECQGCGEPISEQFARVFGGNDDEVQVCLSCGKKNGARRRDKDVSSAKRRDKTKRGELTWETQRSEQ